MGRLSPGCHHSSTRSQASRLRGGGRAVLRRARSLSRGFQLVGSTTAPRSLSSLPDPVILECLSRACRIRTPRSPLLREPSTAVGQVLCESVIRLVRHVLVSPPLSNFPEQRSHVFARDHVPNQTTIIFVALTRL